MGLRLVPGVPRRDAVEALMRYAFNDLGCVHLEFSDQDTRQDDLTGLRFDMTISGDHFVDLRPDEDQIYHNMNRSARRYCNREGSQRGLTVEEARDDGFAEDFCSQMGAVFARQGLVPTFGRERVLSLMRHLMPTGNLLLLRTRDSAGRCVATGIFVGLNQRGHFWGNSSGQDTLALRPNEPLHWYAMCHWKRRGMVEYEMGGGGYTEKYGAKPCQQLRFRRSKYRWIGDGRNLAEAGYRLYQRIAGRPKRIERGPCQEET
jgi:hypothetical protein